MIISTFEALSLLPPNRDSFVFYDAKNRKGEAGLDELSEFVNKHHTSVLSREIKTQRCRIRFGDVFFYVSDARVKKLLVGYGLEWCERRTGGFYKKAKINPPQ